MVFKNEHSLRSDCPLARGLDLLGDHWTLLIVRDLLLMGKHEYRQLLESDEGISSNILTDRLQKLQDNGIVAVIPHPDSGRRKLYYLTPAGKDLIYVLMALGQWVGKHVRGQVVFPPAVSEKIKKNPNTFVAQVMAELDAWEARYLRS